MAYYIKSFQTYSEYAQWENSEDYLIPNVCLISDDHNIIYNDNKISPKNYLRFTAIEDSTISLTNNNSNSPNIEYSLNGTTDWTTWDYSEISLPSGTTVYMKGNNPDGFCKITSDGEMAYSNFVMTGKIESHGNIISLLYNDEFEGNLDIPNVACYMNVFGECTSLITPPELPSTGLTEYCYFMMFDGCTSLTTAPELPATKLKFYCYANMFCGTDVLPDCTNIDFTNEEVVQSGALIGLFANTKVTDVDLMDILPINSETGKYYLPVETLSEYCYAVMFYGCTSLTTAPELPATTLAEHCYSYMFEGCTSLTTAPSILPATTLAEYCYPGMFNGCSSLTTAPELPATTLANDCYEYMFNGCSSLNSITMLATDISASNCLSNWVDGVASTGTFIKNTNMLEETIGRGVSGIPEGWTVNNYE